MITRFWNWGVKTFIPCAIPGVVIVALAKTGALLQNNLFIFAMIVGICIVTLLVAFNKLKEPYYPHLIGSIGFALLLQSTLLGPGLIGTDIHTEYYFYYKALDGWDASIPHAYNSAVGTTLIAPFLTNVFRLPGYWIYKVIFPLLFTFVPFLLYFIFKKEFGSKAAFFASLFFIMIPTWSLEMIGIPKQMLGELMFTLCLFLVLVSSWRFKIRVPLLVVLGTLGATFHYVMGSTIVLYLGLGCLFLLFLKKRVFPIKWLGLVVILLLVISSIYYGLVAQGVPLACITSSSYTQIVGVLPKLPKPPDALTVPPEFMTPTAELVDEAPVTATGFFARQSPLIRAALGLDFMDVSTWGKIFRVSQYLTQLAIVVGSVYLIKERKRYSAEYLSLCGASILLLGACVFLPRFSTIINATRFYHLALFLLAPVFVLGGKAIFRNFKILTVCLIIPYFLFTSGLIFEATQQTDISGVNIPYSISLSHRRVDIIGVSTSNDIAVRDWAVNNDLGSIYADIHGSLLFSEKVELDWGVNWRFFANALSTGEFKEGRYIFLSERNNRDGTITLKPFSGESTSGMRVSHSYEEVGLDKLISEGEIIYRQGNAYILEIKNVACGTD